MDHQMTERKIWDSLPSIPTELAAMASDCGEIILPTTPPEVLAAVMRWGSSPMFSAAVFCRLEKSALAEVSEPVTAVPSQPSTGEKNANAAPRPATAVPIASVWPEKFMT